MVNSFYYFFSATPQVLAAILALFGVFVIFKIQNIKTQLIGIGQTIYNLSDFLNSRTGTIFSKKVKNNQFILALERVLKKNEVNELKSVIELIDDDLENSDMIEVLHFKLYRENYCEVFKILQSLIKRTIRWSIFTALLTIICLTTIPLADLILNNNYILFSLFIVVIGCLIVIFINLISILKEALS